MEKTVDQKGSPVELLVFLDMRHDIMPSFFSFIHAEFFLLIGEYKSFLQFMRLLRPRLVGFCG